MNRCLLCEARSYVYNMGSCAGCIARNIQRMPSGSARRRSRSRRRTSRRRLRNCARRRRRDDSWGWGINDVRGYLLRRGVKVPARSDCAWCYDQTLAEWFELLIRYPAIFEQGERLEAQTGHTFRSPSRDTWPVSLKDLRAKFQAGVIPPRVELTADLFDEPERCRMCTL